MMQSVNAAHAAAGSAMGRPRAYSTAPMKPAQASGSGLRRLLGGIGVEFGRGRVEIAALEADPAEGDAEPT
jgi:hypothetical protein